MELLVDAFTAPADWSLSEFLRRRSTGSAPLAYLRLTRHAGPGADEPEAASLAVVIDPEEFRAEAGRLLRAEYPEFTLRFAVESGLADLYRWRGRVNWWWFTAFSENSPLRTPLIRRLYWLALIDATLRAYTIERTSLATDDPTFADAFRDLLRTRRAGPGEVIVRPWGPTAVPVGWRVVLRAWLRRCLVHGGNWLILRAARLRREVRPPKASGPEPVVLYSRFPVLWEQAAGRLRERMYGNLPEYLRARGYSLLYAVILSLRPRELLRSLPTLRRQARAEQIIVLESLWSVGDLLRVWLTLGPVWRYFAWRRRATQPIRFCGVDIRAMLLRELDAEIVGDEFARDVGIYAGMKRLIRDLGSVRCVLHPFEYQPMERALWFGVKAAGGRTPVVGIQTSILASNHLPFFFPADGLRRFAIDHGLGPYPLPDFLVAYGRNAYEAWRGRLEPERLVLAGPVRYPELSANGRARVSREALVAREGLPAGSQLFLVVGTILREETLALVEGALSAASGSPAVFLLFKFHYHCPLTAELERLAGQMGFVRYRVFETGLSDLIRISRGVITGESASAIDALALGTMPLVYLPPGDFGTSPVLDMPEAAFVWSRPDQLARWVRECVTEGPEYLRRQRHWSEAIETMLYRLDGRADERLYEFLRRRDVL